MGSDAELNREILRKLSEISEKLGGSSSFASYGDNSEFVRDGSRSQDPVSAVRRTAQEMDNFRESVKDAMSINKKVFKSMLEGIPIYGKYNRAVKEATTSVERQSRGQSEAFKKSASAMNEFAANVGVNSKSFEKVTNTMAKVYDTTNRLKDLTKKRMALEENINASLKQLGVRQEEIDSEYRDLPQVLKDVKERIKNETDKGTKQKLEQTRQNLERLNEIPESIAKLTEVMNDSQLKKLAEKHPEVKAVLDPMFKRLESLLKVDESGARRSSSMEELEATLNESAESTDELKGALTASTTWMQRLGKMFDERARDLEKALDSLRKSLGAALGEAISKEANLVMIRQRFTGNTGTGLFGSEGYSARKAALTMGMGEADLLGSVAENRNVIRRIAQDSGMAGGAGELLQSGQLRDLQRLSREMGYMGKEALDNIVKVSDDLRVLGVELDPKNIRDSVEFYRDTFKDLGMTQEQMRKFFAQMSSEGMLRALSAGDDARLASVEAMQNEVEFRGKLARVLNQELEIQQKRVRELAGLAYGGPGEAIKRSIGVQILAEQAGMDQSTVRLLGEQTRTGGVSLDEGERRLAATNYNRLVGDIGGLLHDAVRTDDTGMRAMLTQVMGMAGVEGRDAVEAYIRRGGDIGDLSVDDVLGSARAETERVASQVGKWGHATVTTLEHMQGALQSSIGKSANAIIGAILFSGAGSYFGTKAGLRSASGKGIFGSGRSGGPMATRNQSFGRRAAGMGGRLLRGGGIGLPVALGGMAISGMAPEGKEGDIMRTGGGALGGAGTGAALGSFFGVPGLVVGGIGGALVGGAASMMENKRSGLVNKAVGHQTIGNFGVESENIAREQERQRRLTEEYREAFRKGDTKKMQAVSSKMNFSPEAAKARGIVQNIQHSEKADLFSNKFLDALGLGGGSDEKTLEYMERSHPDRYDYDSIRGRIESGSAAEQQASAQIEQFIEEQQHREILDKGTLTMLIDFLKESESTKDDELIGPLTERLDILGQLTDRQLEILKEGNEQDRKMYKDMSEKEIRESIENALSGQANAAHNRIIGRAGNFAERE